jgi:phage replication initiation protein
MTTTMQTKAGKQRAAQTVGERSETRAALAAETPPTVNTGGQSQPVVVLDGRELKIVTVRSPVLGNFSHIDSLRFTTKEMAFDPLRQCVTEFDFMDSMRHFLKTVFGFTTFEKQDKGRDFYLWSFIIGDKKCQLGAVSFGGDSQRGTVSIYLTGMGCLHALEGWEQRLYTILNQHKEIGYGPSLTRCDIAHDDIAGTIKVRQCPETYMAGGFDRLHNRPLANQAGNWIGDDPNGKGLTFYVGTRHSSQLLRVYEKGKQLGDSESEWSRVEVQFSSHDRILPLEMLITPDEFLVAAYPVFAAWFGHWSKLEAKTLIKKKSAEIVLEVLEFYHARSYGKLVNVWKRLGHSAEEIVTKILAGIDPEQFPRRLAALVPIVQAPALSH